MKIEFNKQDLLDYIREDVSRLAARAQASDGTPLYDSIRLTSRDDDMMERMLSYRDGQVREFLAFCVEDTGDTGYNIVYNIVESRCSKVMSMASLKSLLQQYLVDGVLCDWYTRHGIESPITYDSIDALKSRLVVMLRQGGYRRPLQPFGPKYK